MIFGWLPSFLAPERLWVLVLVPLLVAGYIYLVLRKKKTGMRFTNTAVLSRVVPKQSQWRRHLAVALSLAALVALLAAGVAFVGQGPGPVHYSWHVEGVPLAATEGGETQGIELKRRFVDAQMAEVRPEDLRQGRAVFVELTVKADRRLHNVVLVDLLPACLEIENPHLATSEHFEEMLSGDLSVVERVEARDDRMVIFCSLEAPNEARVLRYPCRVVSTGRFVQGPASAECMYDPEVRARTPGGEVRVRPMNER